MSIVSLMFLFLLGIVIGVILMSLKLVTVGLIIALACLAVECYLCYRYYKLRAEQKKTNEVEAQQKIENAKHKAEMDEIFQTQYENAKKRISEIDRLLENNNENQSLLLERRELQQQVNYHNGIHEYIPMPGYEITGYHTTQTMVRGTQYHLDEDDYELLDIDDEVQAIHEPEIEYPESTTIYCNNIILGKMKKDMAEDYVARFGKEFTLSGHLVKKTRKRDEDTGEMFYNIVVELNVPILRK